MADGRFAAQVAALAGARVLAMGAGFVTVWVGARLLGPTSLGSAAVAQTVGLVAALVASGGLNIVTIYRLGALPGSRAAVLGLIRPWLWISAGLAAALTVVIALTIGPALGLAGSEALWTTAALLSAAVIAHEFWGSVLLGFGNSRAYTQAEVVRAVGTALASSLIIATAARNEVGFLLGALVASIAAASFAWARARSSLPRSERPSGPLVRDSVAMGIRGQVGNVLQFLNLRLDLLLLPALLDLTAAGLYAVAVRVSEVVAQMASASGSLIFPETAAARDGDAAARLTEVTTRRSLLFVALGAIIISALAEPILTVFGTAFTDAATTLRILMVAMLPLTVTRVLAGDLKGRGRPGVVSLVMGISVVATIGLDLVLIPIMGISGAAVASLLAYAVSAAGLAVAFTRVTHHSPLSLLPQWNDVVASARWIRGGR